MKDYLRATFGENIISQGFDFYWPPRSPDLNPCDFWLWGYLKANVYTHQPENLNVLKARIITAMANIPQAMINNTVKSIIPRLEFCIGKNGGHINPNYN